MPKMDGVIGKEKRLLGKTPLVLHASEAPSMKFWVMIHMDAFLKQIERIPKLRDWAAKIRSGRFPSGYIPKLFEFEDFEYSSMQNTLTQDGEIVGMGPLVSLDFPRQSRIAVVFLPKGEKVSTLFPIMPPRGTFRGADSYKRILINEYNVPEGDASEAIEALSRCGKAWILVPDSPRRGHTRELIITHQGKGNTIVTITENKRRSDPARQR